MERWFASKEEAEMGEREVLILPKLRREMVMKIAHNSCWALVS